MKLFFFPLSYNSVKRVSSCWLYLINMILTIISSYMKNGQALQYNLPNLIVFCEINFFFGFLTVVSSPGIGPGQPPDSGGWFIMSQLVYYYTLYLIFWKNYTLIFCLVYFLTYKYEICDLFKNFNVSCN